MKKIAIIGLGLIGGSLGMALRRSGHYCVTGIGRDDAKLRRAKRKGAADIVTTDLRAGVGDADIVVLAVPVDRIAPVLKAAAPFLKEGAVVTDAGSVKGAVHAAVQKVLPRGRRISFVGAHPMAGREKSGIDFAAADLFRGATVVVTGGGTASRPAAAVARMWRTAGARVVSMEPQRHDALVALISHLPHVAAFSLCRMIAPGDQPEAGQLAAGSFRDMTRVADSSPRDWAAICSGNAEALARVIDAYIRELKAVRADLRHGARLEKRFSAARQTRRRLV